MPPSDEHWSSFVTTRSFDDPQFTGVWRSVAVSVSGASHRQAEKPGHDASWCDRFALSGSLLIVADGAGSCRYPDWASREVVRIARNIISTETTDLQSVQCAEDALPFLAKIMNSIEKQFRNLLQLNEIESKDALSTLGIAVIDEPFVYYMGIGDGFIITQTKSGRYYLPVPIMRTGRYQNQASFIGHDSWQEAGFSYVLWDPEIVTVGLSSDGLEEAFLDYLSPVDGNPGVEPLRPIPERLSGVVDKLSDPSSDLRHISDRLSELLLQDWINEWSSDDLSLALACKRRPWNDPVRDRSRCEA